MLGMAGCGGGKGGAEQAQGRPAGKTADVMTVEKSGRGDPDKAEAPGASGQAAAQGGEQAEAGRGASQAEAERQGAAQGEARRQSRKTYSAPPKMTIDTNKKYFATLKTTKGDMKIELFAGESPKTVNNFVFLARAGFYDGVRFHRIMKDFMVQTGDPNGDGSGGPGYAFEDELPPKHSYEKGMVAMANAGPDTNGSQFFICSGPECKFLDMMPNYTQFGRVVAGMDVLDRIASVPVGPSPFGEVSDPREEVRIESVVIEER